MPHFNSPNHNQPVTSVSTIGSTMASGAALTGLRSQLNVVEQNVHDLLSIADRACGTPPPQADAKGGGGPPTAAPDGLLDELDNDVTRLIALTNIAVARLSRIA